MGEVLFAFGRGLVKVLISLLIGAGAGLLLVNTRARHALADGEYGRRRAECEEAARRLGVPSLRSVTDPAEVDRLDDPVLRRRARHVVADDQRVLEVVALLRSFVEYAKPVHKAKELSASAHTAPSAELTALNRTSTGLLLRAVASAAVVLIVIDMIWKPGA